MRLYKYNYTCLYNYSYLLFKTLIIFQCCTEEQTVITLHLELYLPALAGEMTSLIPHRMDTVPEAKGTQDFFILKSLKRDTVTKARTRMKWKNYSLSTTPGLYRLANKEGHMSLYWGGVAVHIAHHQKCVANDYSSLQRTKNLTPSPRTDR